MSPHMNRSARISKALVFGGTGVVGKPIVEALHRQKVAVWSVSLEKASLPSAVSQCLIDRSSPDYENSINQLHAQAGGWDLVVDTFSFDDKTGRETHRLFKEKAKHIVTISTTLVYDRTSQATDDPIAENTPLAQAGQLGGYVDGKLKLEEFWRSVDDVAWTIFRPYHILGRSSLLGCAPEHNRDPKLLERLRNGERLRLAGGGSTPFNYVHPKDIAQAICEAAGNSKAFSQAYNLVNPEEITAREYYTEIARQVGGTLLIEPVSIETIWNEQKGWEMTTLPHLYSVQKLKKDFGFVPATPLSEAIKDSIESYPTVHEQPEKIPVHQRINKLPRPKKPSWLR